LENNHKYEGELRFGFRKKYFFGLNLTPGNEWMNEGANRVV
jgi:hypothetical protein